MTGEPCGLPDVVKVERVKPEAVIELNEDDLMMPEDWTLEALRFLPPSVQSSCIESLSH
ncbi:hypothetical protein GCM10022631_07190 [Deinococcus rubellus]|uniref:hypothetical protein n=1 Tax=Deinococcus rubellus TaxID=1889240 RepID=UPI0031E7F3B3